MDRRVSKSQFKPRALEFFREVERSGDTLVITDHGRPVLRLVRYETNPTDLLRPSLGSVLRYDRPTEPLGISFVRSWVRSHLQNALRARIALSGWHTRILTIHNDCSGSRVPSLLALRALALHSASDSRWCDRTA